MRSLLRLPLSPTVHESYHVIASGRYRFSAEHLQWLANPPRTLNGNLHSYQKDQFLSEASLERINEFDRAYLVSSVLPPEPPGPNIDVLPRCYYSVRDLHEQSRSSWFLFWRSPSFRKELADTHEEVRKLKADSSVSAPSEQTLPI